MFKIKQFFLSIFQHFKQHFWFYLITFVILGLFISTLLTLLTPKKNKVIESDFVITNYDQTQTTFKKVEFTGEKITLPDQMAIYTIKSNNQSADQLAQTIIQRLGLIQSEKNSNSWDLGNKSLIKRIYENAYSLYDLDEASPSTQLASINVDQAIETCDQFFQGASSVNLLADKENIVYYGQEEESGEVAPTEAARLLIPYSQQIGSYRVYLERDVSAPFLCYINNSYHITSVVFKDFFYDFIPSVAIDSVSLDQALKNINNGKASIIDATTNYASTFDLNWIKEARFDKVEIVYRYDSTLKAAYPFYQFTGSLVNNDGITLQAKVITPAVLSEADKTQGK